MEDLKKIFETKYSRANWQAILKEYFGTKVIYEKPIPVEIKNNDYKATAVELGSFETEEKYIIGVYEIDLPTNKVNLFRNKKTIRDLLSLHYKNNVDGALVVFKQDSTNKWRFSYVTELKQNATHWKRFTYLLGEGERCKTASDRFEKIKAITKSKNDLPIQALSDAFSVEKMSIEFFDTYRKHYGKFTTYLTGEDENGKKAGASRVMSGFATFFPNEQEVAKKNARDFVKKMMGRIVFLYFLEKKGWLGVPEAGEWGEGDEFFMSNLIKDAKNPSIFYSEVLVPLFFDTLNNPRPDELFKIKASVFKTIEFNKLKIPYLNGGLFEEDVKALRNLVLPEKLFYNPKATTEDEFGLFQFLDQYNFTVDEDSKLDHTVAVDPEMMGHIFENLLEDNKAKGTFYTPKPIVEYMCQESLLYYLSTKLKADDELRKKLDVLIRVEGDGMEPLLEYLPAIVKALKEVKICDPAIGSGAFPMGMLMEIYHIMEKLSTYKIARDAWPIQQWDKDSHKIKLNVIQNNIYGVDIEKGAVDIARLRFWLSLIVDLEKPQALPNLDYKIVQGNSLLNELHINSNYKINVDIDWDIDGKRTVASTKQLMDTIAKDLKTLNDKQKNYFEPSSDKKAISQQIRDLKVDILTNQIELDKTIYEIKSREQGELFSESKVDKQKELDIKLKLTGYNDALKHLKGLKLHAEKPLHFFNFELDFAEVMNVNICKNSGFDIVIGNPPYGAKFTDEDKELFRKLYPETQFKIDSYSLFLLKSIPLLKNDGINYFIIPNTFLDNYFEEKVRYELLKNHSIYEILDLSDCVFERAVVHSMIFSFRKTASPAYNIKINADNNLLGEKKLIPNEFFLKQDKYLISIRNYDSKDLFEKLNINSVPLENVLDIRQTIKTGDDKKYIVDKIKGKNYKPILRGKDVRKYENTFANLYVGYGSHLACPRDPKIFEQPKILIREAGSEITATYDDENYYIMSSLYNGIPIDKSYDLKYILALLNSKLFQYQMNKLTFEKTKGAFTKARIFHYYKLPIKRLKDQTSFVKLIDKILKLKAQKKSSTNEENELDLMIYKLYDLSYEEALIIDETINKNILEEKYNSITYHFTYQSSDDSKKIEKLSKKSKQNTKNVIGLSELNFD